MKDENTGARGPRALVVDDDETILRLMRILVEEAGFQCTCLATGEAAVALLQKERAAILIADKNLPGMTGIEVIAEAKRLDPWIRTVVITGYASDDSAVEAMGLGVDAYISKPIDLHDFRKLLFALVPGLGKADEDDDPTVRTETPRHSMARIEEKLRRIGEHIRAQAEADGPVEEEDRAAVVRRQTTLLVIEESAPIREALVKALGARHSVVAFDSPHHAKAHVLRLGYDLLLAGREILLRHLEELITACPRPPLGCVAIVPRRGFDITTEVILLGARGMIAETSAREEIVSEVDRVLALLRKERAAMGTIPPVGPPG
jgi:DNA-binding NtrC family response regulator